MAASAGGIDALVFTGGTGERSPLVREQSVARLAFLGLSIDRVRNEAHRGGDEILSSPKARAAVIVVEAREDIEIARATRRVPR